MLFGKKKKQDGKQAGDASPGIEIETIPDAFYGGQDPVVYHRAPVGGAGDTAMPPRSMPTVAPVAAKTPMPQMDTGSVSFFKKRWVLIVGATLLFLGAVGAISWYYIQGGQGIPKATPTTTNNQGTPVTIPVASTTTPPIIVGGTTTSAGEIPTTTPINVPTSTPSLLDRPIEFPSAFLVDSADLDRDDLTDAEEDLFETDTGTSDTDGDGYNDGLEVRNLYNPKGFAPIRIIDSGLVREYVNPTFQYRVYYPVGFAVASVDPESRQVLLSAITGDFIEIRAVDKRTNESFPTWFARNASGQQFSDLQSTVNRFKESGYQRKDRLVAYVESEQTVYVLVFHPASEGPISYRHIMDMVFQSFRPNKTFIPLPDQPVLPTGSSTTTSESGV